MSAAALHNRLNASHSPRPEMSFPPDTRKRIENTTVLIPAAGRVPEGIIALSNISCPAMIPVGGRPVIHWTMSYLRSLGLRRFIIAVAHRGMYVEDFVECTFGKDCDITFTVPTTDASVGGTLHDLAEATLTESALVAFSSIPSKTPTVGALPKPTRAVTYRNSTIKCPIWQVITTH
jgi:hypothetical protein